LSRLKDRPCEGGRRALLGQAASVWVASVSIHMHLPQHGVLAWRISRCLGMVELCRPLRRCIRGGKAARVHAVSLARRRVLLMMLVLVGLLTTVQQLEVVLRVVLQLVVVVELRIVLPVAFLLLLRCPRSSVRLLRELLVRPPLARCTTSSPMVPNAC